MLTAIRNATSRIRARRKASLPVEKPTVSPGREHFKIITEEVRCFGTDYYDLLRPAFASYQEDVYAPLIASERRLMAHRHDIELLCHELIETAPDLVRAVRRNSALSVHDIHLDERIEEIDRD